MGDSGVRLADVLVSLSLLTDLGFSQPAEHMVRSTRLAMRIGDRLGLDDEYLACLYDVSLLTYVGCSVYGNDAAALFGDDLAFRAGALETDLAGLEGRRFMLGRAGSGASPLTRIGVVAGLMATGGRAVTAQMAQHCVTAGLLAERIGLDAAARAGIEQAYARWDGKGVPSDLAGDRLSLAARIAHVATACEVFERNAGIDGVLGVVNGRRGTHFDPSVVAAVETDPSALFEDLGETTIDDVLDLEPSSRPPLTEDELTAVLAAIGDFCDMRCPCFAGHSQGTAELVEAAGRSLDLPDPEVTLLRRAAHVHDVGRFGVPATVWDKPGPLSTTEVERMRMHVYLVERVFSRPEPLRRIGLLAATHHERMDGSGYHRGIGGPMLSTSARLLAAADTYHAMLQPRPHRPARSDDDAAAQLRQEVDAGRLDGTAVDAVLTAAGHRAGRTRAPGPAGLTGREVEVLALLVQGLPNKGIARHLSISPKTVSNHLERIYAKLEVQSRAAAAMRAMQLGIVAA